MHIHKFIICEVPIYTYIYIYNQYFYSIHLLGCKRTLSLQNTLYFSGEIKSKTSVNNMESSNSKSYVYLYLYIVYRVVKGTCVLEFCRATTVVVYIVYLMRA
jgi:hypothetical protein